jgi:hypothetical protein
MAGTRRTPIHRPPRGGISQKAIDLFIQIMEYDEDGHIALELHRELGLKPWDTFVTWVDINDEPPPNIEPWKRASFERAVELRRQLISLCT